MLGRSPNLWHSLGYHAERARSAVAGSGTAGGGGAAPGATRRRASAGHQELGREPIVTSPAGRFAVSAGVSLFARTFHRWLGRKSPSLPGLLRGAAAGVGAAGILAAVRYAVGDRPPSLDGEPDLLDELLEGAGDGLVYAAIVAPNVPAPPVVRGLLLGAAEHLAAPWGGVLGSLRGAAPHAKVPGLQRLLTPLDVGERPVFDHLLFATVLAVLYGKPSRARKRSRA